MTENTRVGPADFAVEDDLPIGQVLRRFGERRLGVAHDDNALTPVQERLAVLMARKAHGVQDRSHSPMVAERRPLHLDVGSRYLPLRVDAAFGRFGAFEHQSLMPKGNWVYQLDADLLRLWVEEELESEAEAQGWLRAETWASPASRTPEADRLAPRPSAPGRAAPRIGQQLPPAVRKSLAPHRQQVKNAVLAAVRGDTSALARMTHGSAVAKRLLAKIQAQTSSAKGLTSASLATAAAPGVAATAQADRVEDRAAIGLTLPTPAPRFSTALDHDDLIALRDELPMLAVDAADISFSFEGAARQIMRTARTAVTASAAQARRSTPQAGRAAQHSLTPALARALESAQTRIVARARMMGPSPEQTAIEEAQALALTAFTPRATANLGGHETDITGADRTVASRLGGLSAQSVGARRQEFGTQALKAIRFDTRAARHAEPDVSSYWLMEGGRGVLLAGLDDSGIPLGQHGTDWSEPDSSAPPQWAPPSHRVAVALAANAPSPLIATSGLGEMAGTVAVQQPPALFAPLVAFHAQQAAGQGAVGGPAAIAAAPVEIARRPGLLAALARARTYDATVAGDFAAVVADGLTHRAGAGMLLRRLEASASSPLTPSAAGDRASTSGVGGPSRDTFTTANLSRASVPHSAREAILQDIVVSGGYLPSLVRSIAELQRTATFLGRLQPAALASAAHQSATPVRARSRLGSVIQRLTALSQDSGPSLATTAGAQLETRAATAAGQLADAIREARQAIAGGDRASTGYDNAGWWGVDSILLQMESAAATDSSFSGWSPDASGVSDLHRSIDVATRRAQTTVVAQLAQIASATREAAASAARAADVASQTNLSRTAGLRLFSPEKTVALIAPELESGGLLDVGARRALSQALDALSQASATSVQTRSVRTPFGNIKVRLDHGRIVVDTEEISSHAPVVSVAAGTARSELQLATTPTRSVRAFERTANFTGQTREPSGSRFAAGELARALESTLPTVLQSMRGVSARLDVLLGGPARSEARSDASTRRLTSVASDLHAAQARMSKVLAAAPSEMTARFSAIAQSTAPLATSRLDSAGDVIRLFAGSERAARVIQSLSAGGFADAELAAFDAAPSKAASTAPPEASMPASTRARLGQLGAALAGLGTRRSANVARVLRDLSEGRDVALPIAARSAEALGELLAEAADARAIGSLGQLGMARQIAPGMSRADLAYILPYAQRSTKWAHGDLDLTGASPTQSHPDHASALLEMAVSLGRGRQMLDGVAALNLSAAGTAGPTNGPLADLSSDPTGPGRIGLGLTNAGHTAPGYHRTAGGPTTFVTPRDALDRTLAQREGSRFARLQATLSSGAAAPTPAGGPTRTVTRSRGMLAPRAMTAGVLRNLLQVRSTLDGLGNRPQARSGPHLAVSTEAAGALLQPERAHHAADIGWSGLDSTTTRPSTTHRADGTAGVWMPAGVERLVAETADAIVSGRASLAGTLVAPRLLTPQRTRSGQRGTRTRGAAGQAGSYDAVAHQVAMGLRSLRFGSAPGGRAESAGTMLAVGAGAGALNASPWMTSTRSQEGARRLAASLGMEWAAPGTSRAQAAAGVDLQSPDLVRPGSPGTGDGPGALFKPPAAPPKPRARAAKAPGTLYSPPKPPSLPTPETFGPGTAQAEAVAPRAARTQDSSGGMVERAEAEDRTGMAHQSGVPSQENIEDIAYEVLSELKRRWSYELERRGTE